MTTLTGILPMIDETRAARVGLAVAIVVASSRDDIPPGTRLLFYGDDTTAVGDHALLHAALMPDAREALQQRRSSLRSYRWREGLFEYAGIEGGDITVFLEVLGRRQRLVIVGAGHIAVPLAAMAAVLDFEVVILDDRPEYASRERFPAASNLLVGPYRSTLAGVSIDSDTFVVLVTRGHVHDQACLEEILESPAAYIGMIGSRRRVRTVSEHAASNGSNREKLRRVHAPIGLDIGAQTPAEIAVAILAEIINVRRGGAGRSLALGERLRV